MNYTITPVATKHNAVHIPAGFVLSVRDSNNQVVHQHRLPSHEAAAMLGTLYLPTSGVTPHENV